jgi:YHS domain-containing protein
MNLKILVTNLMAMAISATLTAQKSPIFLVDGLAIRGYDPVALFKASEAQKGSPNFEQLWQGVRWQFASAANRDSFALNPEKYAPQFGGYCAYGCAKGHKAPTQIDTWSIVNGKLYFNYNQKVKELWSKDQTAYIAKANEAWPSVKASE